MSPLIRPATPIPPDFVDGGAAQLLAEEDADLERCRDIGYRYLTAVLPHLPADEQVQVRAEMQRRESAADIGVRLMQSYVLPEWSELRAASLLPSPTAKPGA